MCLPSSAPRTLAAAKVIVAKAGESALKFRAAESNLSAMSKRTPDPDFSALEKFDPNEFGSVWPDIKEFREFSLGPWHELRRHLALFMVHVAPADMKQLEVREAPPSPDIENRCDFFVLDFIRSKNRKKLLPAPELRKWLALRAKMAIIMATREEELKGKDKSKNPDLKNKFEDEVGIRLTIYWHRMGKELWLDCDPDQTSAAE
ncbi:MAG: hypothetical protein JWM68_1621 [Verrucomicrobiales bacterium]|nr:hypothetical protein [Verrucomicrobiales bacterium]